MENVLYLLLSVSCSAGRNIASKKSAIDAKHRSHFFYSQTLLFLSAAVVLLLTAGRVSLRLSGLTVFLGLLYGISLILSQWMLTLSLKKGSTSVCSVIYSLGFLFPTLSGTLFWQEGFPLTHGIGTVLALAVILFSMKKEPTPQTTRPFPGYILIAMAASGGLGILQKVQQTSAVATERTQFLLIGFLFAIAVSFAAFLFTRQKGKTLPRRYWPPCVTGGCFGVANICNTILAGRLPSAVLFPVLNISVILLSTLLSIVFFREKITFKTAVVLLLGIGVVGIFSL